MKLRGQQSILLVSSLVLYCSVGWTQTFYTNIQGTAVTCTRKDYSEAARGDISDQTSDSCQGGNASVSSSASLDTHQIAKASAQNGGAAGASAKALQTATLIPPKGFTGKTVVFSYTNIWALNLSGVGPGTGMAKACVGFPQLGDRVCQATETNGPSSGTMHGTFKLTKSSGGFKLSIENIAYAEAAGNAPPPPIEPLVSAGAIIQSNPTLILPKGWKCKYDSGTSCP
jgi:hypothetical protein